MKQYEVSDIFIDNGYIYGKVVVLTNQSGNDENSGDTLQTMPAANIGSYSLTRDMKGKHATLRTVTDATGVFKIEIKERDVLYLVSNDYPFTNTLYEAISVN